MVSASAVVKARQKKNEIQKEFTHAGVMATTSYAFVPSCAVTRLADALVDADEAAGSIRPV